MLEPKAVIATILESCLSHSVDIFSELQFWAENEIWGNVIKQLGELDSILLVLAARLDLLDEMDKLGGHGTLETIVFILSMFVVSVMSIGSRREPETTSLGESLHIDRLVRRGRFQFSGVKEINGDGD